MKIKIQATQSFNESGYMKPVSKIPELASIVGALGIATLAGILYFKIADTAHTAAAGKLAQAKASQMKPGIAATPLSGKPGWKELNASQQKALLPLQAHWETLDEKSRAKWLGIANRYVSLNPDEQKRIQKRMEAWAQLSPEQKQIARLNYSQAKKLEAAQKSRQWEAYQQLPAEQKQLLASGVPAQFAKLPSPKPLADTINTALESSAASASVAEQSAASASQGADQDARTAPAFQADWPMTGK
ncbi:DUF3106 domain-containing protein [Undibacterium pigrum]|nr:DUF3106 domain-containing protein [Undibacterium pigrum]